MIAWMKANGRQYLAHGTTLGPCWTSRTEWFTGLVWPAHCFNPAGSFGAVTEYTQTYDVGAKRSVLGRPAVWAGPYNNSRSAIMGLPDTRLTQAAQQALGVTRAINPGDTPDDVQRSSGSIFQEVARYDIPICFLGKYNNQHRLTNNIPAGITNAHIQILNADAGNQYEADLQEYEGPNPYDGTGVSVTTSTHYDYDRGNIANIGNWSPIGGGRVRIALSSLQHKFVASDIGGDFVVVDNCTITEYNGVWTLVALGTNPDGSVPNNTHCWFACPTNFGTATSGAGKLYNKTEIPINKYIEIANTFIDNCVTNETPGLIWINPHQTHSTDGESPSGYAASAEREYIDTVDPAIGPYFNETPGGWCPTADPSHPVSVQQVWQKVMEQMKSVGDLLNNLVFKMESVRPGNWYLILTSDQGMQNGEQWTRGDGGIKSAVWEGSRRSFMIIVGPGVTPSSTFDRPTMHADIPATVLEMFGLMDNHMHTSRDGVSLLSIVNPSHPAYDRVIPNFGDMGSGTGQSFLRKDGIKYIRPTGNPSAGKTYEIRKDPDGDYETVATSPTPGDLADYNALMDDIIDFQFNNTTDSSPWNDGSFVL